MRLLSLRRPSSPGTVLMAILCVATSLHFYHYVFNRNLVFFYYAPPDLKSFYWGVQAVLSQNTSPYDVAYLKQLANDHVFPYLYPPTSLLLLAPLNLSGFAQAHIAMLALNHFLVVLLAILFSAILCERASKKSLQISVVCLLLNFLFIFTPVRATFALGQINLIVLAFLALFILCLQREKAPSLAALLLMVPVVLKTYPALLVIYLVAQRQYRIIGFMLVYALIIVIASLALLPNGLWQIWLFEIFPKGNYGAVPEGLNAATVPWNQNLNALMHRSLVFFNQRQEALHWQPNVVNAAAYCISITLLMVTYLVSSATDARKKTIPLLDCGLFLLLILMVAPLTWDHHFVFAIPALLGCIAFASKNWRHNKLKLVSLVIISLTISSKLKFSSPIFSHEGYYLLASTKFFMVVWLWLIGLKILSERKSSTPTELVMPANYAA